MEKLKEKLSQYGTIRTCKEVHPDVVTVVLTDGFEETSTLAVMLLVVDAFPEHPIMETAITEHGFAMFVLRRKID